MGCLMAEGPLSKCLCPCEGAKHGLLVDKTPIMVLKCSPAVEKRCKAGNESGRCKCACEGQNHGLYQGVDFTSVKITGLVAA